MIQYRCFRNTDPPHLARIWNEAFPGRTSYLLQSPEPLERWLFSKPYFDIHGLIVATEKDVPVGFAHAGFGPNADQTALDYSQGINCIVALSSSYRRQGIGRELLRQSEAYLIHKGAKQLYAGSVRPFNPFYFGLYGGSDSPGFLSSDGDAGAFFESFGYQPYQTILVYHRMLHDTINVVDTRFAALHRRFDVQIQPWSQIGTWWQECIFGQIEPEPLELTLMEKRGGTVVARVVIWEMESYGWRWKYPTAGILKVEVVEEHRRQGLAKYLITQLLRYLQDNYFGLLEMQMPAENQAGMALFESLGFAQIDVGKSYRKTIDQA